MLPHTGGYGIRPYGLILFVGETFRLPWDGKPVPYEASLVQREVACRRQDGGIVNPPPPAAEPTLHKGGFVRCNLWECVL